MSPNFERKRKREGRGKEANHIIKHFRKIVVGKCRLFIDNLRKKKKKTRRKKKSKKCSKTKRRLKKGNLLRGPPAGRIIRRRN